MRSINKVILIGNLTRDPEIRQTPNGQTVTTFGIATNREWVTRDNQKHTSSEFHEVVAWSHLAEICGKHLKKGKLVYIEGYLKTRSWDTPEGIKKFKTEIVIQDMIMLEKRPKNSEEYIPGDEETQNGNNGYQANKSEMDKSESNENKAEYTAPENSSSTESQKQQSLDIDQDLGL